MPFTQPNWYHLSLVNSGICKSGNPDFGVFAGNMWQGSERRRRRRLGTRRRIEAIIAKFGMADANKIWQWRRGVPRYNAVVPKGLPPSPTILAEICSIKIKTRLEAKSSISLMSKIFLKAPSTQPRQNANDTQAMDPSYLQVLVRTRRSVQPNSWKN